MTSWQEVKQKISIKDDLKNKIKEMRKEVNPHNGGVDKKHSHDREER